MCDGQDPADMCAKVLKQLVPLNAQPDAKTRKLQQANVYLTLLLYLIGRTQMTCMLSCWSLSMLQRVHCLLQLSDPPNAHAQPGAQLMVQPVNTYLTLLICVAGRTQMTCVLNCRGVLLSVPPNACLGSENKKVQQSQSHT